MDVHASYNNLVARTTFAFLNIFMTYISENIKFFYAEKLYRKYKLQVIL